MYLRISFRIHTLLIFLLVFCRDWGSWFLTLSKIIVFPSCYARSNNLWSDSLLVFHNAALYPTWIWLIIAHKGISWKSLIMGETILQTWLHWKIATIVALIWIEFSRFWPSHHFMSFIFVISHFFDWCLFLTEFDHGISILLFRILMDGLDRPTDFAFRGFASIS